jgi:23S rRNA (uridine2552-2'-O)-methyltransferase
MTDRDEYYNRAKQEGYRARSAYKLGQLDDEAGLIAPCDTVVDLGAAPGGWMQVAAERVGSGGLVVGVDRKRIDDLDVDARVETVQGDLTDDETIAAISAVVEGEADLVASDTSPNVSGEYGLDHARSVHLARRALSLAKEVLDAGGDYVAKVFEGPDVDDLREEVEDAFEYARTIHPDASRDSSSELYIVGKGRLTAPVRTGDRLSVDVADTGSEGDGVAKVEGFTLFVPDAEAGDTVTVEVTDVKPRFGFAERVDNGG